MPAACTTQKPRTYRPRQPKESTLYQAVSKWWPVFRQLCESDGRGLPARVKDDFSAYLRCGVLEYGFTRRVCETCQYNLFLPFSCQQRSFCPSCCGRRSAENQVRLVDDFLPRQNYRQWVITLPMQLRYLCAGRLAMQNQIHRLITTAILEYYTAEARSPHREARKGAYVSFFQRFGSGLNLNPHFHILFIDGFFYRDYRGILRFYRTQTPTASEVAGVLEKIRNSILAYLQTLGILDERHIWDFAAEDPLADESPTLAQAMNGSIQHRIAFGDEAGHKVEKIGRGYPGHWEDEPHVRSAGCAELNGFTLHCERMVKASHRGELEKLLGYMSRPPMPANALTLREDGKYVYKMKRPYKDGTHSIVFTGLDLMARLAALVPPTGQHLVRYGGCFANHDAWRPEVVLKPDLDAPEADLDHRSTCPKDRYLWAHLLERTLGIDTSACTVCGGRMQTLAVIQDPVVIRRILDHTGLATGPPQPAPCYVQMELFPD